MTGLPRLTLVLGGTRSGKSAYAERILAAQARPLYLATGVAFDEELTARIRLHQARRGPGWDRIEEPLDLPGALQRESRPDRAILVDCLTLWLGNLMHHGRDITASCHELLAVLPDLAGPVVMVSSEVGLGVVPENALARAFRDDAGRLNQLIAAQAERVVLVAAGLPLILKEL